MKTFFGSSISVRTVLSRLGTAAAVPVLAGLLLAVPADEAFAGASSRSYDCGTYSDGSGFCYGTVYNFRYGSPNTTDYFVIKDLETRYTMLAVFQGRAKNASLDQSDSRFKALKPRLDKIIENPRVRFWIYFDIDNKITAVELMTYSGDF